jgi:hypothetical protein
MSYREEPETVQEYIRLLEDRIRSLERGSRINARSWVIGENEDGDLVFTNESGRIVIIDANTSNLTI